MSELIERNKTVVDIEDKKLYKRVTIKMHGKGIHLRDEIVGSKIGTKRQFVVKPGQLLLSKIDARNGAFGIVPPGCAGSVITGNFWAYDINTEAIHPEFFRCLLQTDKFLNFFECASQGLTNRRYLQEPLFLNQEVAIPKLERQQDIVKQLDSCRSFSQEAGKLAENASELLTVIINKSLI